MFVKSYILYNIKIEIPLPRNKGKSSFICFELIIVKSLRFAASRNRSLAYASDFTGYKVYKFCSRFQSLHVIFDTESSKIRPNAEVNAYTVHC